MYRAEKWQSRWVIGAKSSINFFKANSTNYTTTTDIPPSAKPIGNKIAYTHCLSVCSKDCCVSASLRWQDLAVKSDGGKKAISRSFPFSLGPKYNWELAAEDRYMSFERNYLIPQILQAVRSIVPLIPVKRWGRTAFAESQSN